MKAIKEYTADIEGAKKMVKGCYKFLVVWKMKGFEDETICECEKLTHAQMIAEKLNETASKDLGESYTVYSMLKAVKR